MNLTRTILRILLLLLTVLILFYLNIKTEDNIELIAEFKFKTLEHIKTGSLDIEHKLDLLDNETTRFSGQIIEDTSKVREAIIYLIGMVGLLIAVEITFSIAEKRRNQMNEK